MMINWAVAKVQQFLPIVDAGLDELSVSFDFALSAEVMDLLYTKNDGCMAATVPDSLAACPPSMEVRSEGTTPWMEDDLDAGGRAKQGAVAEAANTISRMQGALDEHERALA